MGIGLQGIGLLRPSQMGANLGLIPLVFDPALATFTPHMAKRATSVFAASPIVQGKWADNNGSDFISTPALSAISNYFYNLIDIYQGSIAFWITPEWDGNDGLNHHIYVDGSFGRIRLQKNTSNNLSLSVGGQNFSTSVAGWTAGTRYFVVVRWDNKNTLDGTNYGCISINNAHSFGMTTAGSPGQSGNLIIGANGASLANPADALIEGLTVYRRPLYDGTYGVDVGNGDEIALIHAAGSGQDPTLVTGSWDVVFCLPTNATAEELVTGTGEAWSHPHGSEVVEHPWAEDGGYLGDAWAVAFNGTNTDINCGSDASLDNLISAGAADRTFEAWIYYDDTNNTREILCKDNNSNAGWRIRVLTSDQISTQSLGAATNFVATANNKTIGGSWQHVAVVFQSSDKKAYIAVNGEWATYSGQVALVGTVGDDSAISLHIGKFATIQDQFWKGKIGWVRISNNARYTPGTDFVPPRTLPAADGNTVEQWAMNEGTGATAAAVVNSPANDGTISNGTWEEQWDQEGSPVIPYSLEFDGSATYVNCGSAADIDDVPSGGEITVDGWFRSTGPLATSEMLVAKGSISSTRGWGLFISNVNRPTSIIYTADGPIQATVTSGSYRDGKWHHFVIYYNDTTKLSRVAVDGIWGNSASGSGAYDSDAADDLTIGRIPSSGWWWKGGVGFVRISDNDRFGGAAATRFTPPSRLNPPAPDGNTLRQFNFRDGAGTTLTDATGTANGTITMGSGGWNTTPDLAIDAPGSRVYNWGYTIGVDAANEGFLQTLAGLSAGENYVLRAVLGYERDARAIPQILIYDETNSAEITHLTGPSLNGVHDGGNNSATLGDSTARWPQSLVGSTLYNITDGSSTTITAISGDGQTITGVLAGGTDNDWDNGDEYMIVPPTYWRWAELFCFELPTIARNGAAADCVSISVKVLNTNDEGVFYLHQLELLENLVDNPSLETPGAGANPWIPDGWINSGLDPGDSSKETTIVHSGSGSMAFAALALGEFIASASIGGTGFTSRGCWHYGKGAGTQMSQGSSLGVSIQDSINTSRVNLSTLAAWKLVPGIWRGHLNHSIGYNAGSGGTEYVDDIYFIALDDVSLTVTPASLANSTETTGIRVDGLDTLTQPIPAGYLQATQGWIRWNWTPRHDAADLVKFGNTTIEILRLFFDGTHYISVTADAANNVRTEFNDGGGAHVANWNCAGLLVAGTTYLFEIRYDPSKMQLITDGTIRATITQPIDFGAGIPNTAYWGTFQTGIRQGDATFAKP